jgi:hypothetical protein
MKKKVVFDVDDILWDLNRKAAKLAGISYNDIITFSLNENPLLTDDEKIRLKSVYGSEELFKNIEWFKNIDRINHLNADVHICSNILNLAVADIKRKQIHQVLDISDNNIHLNFVTNGKVKQIPDDTFIFVDDSPYNILDSTAEHNIMLERPWNVSENGIAILGGKPRMMFKHFDSIIDCIEVLLDTNR